MRRAVLGTPDQASRVFGVPLGLLRRWLPPLLAAALCGFAVGKVLGAIVVLALVGVLTGGPGCLGSTRSPQVWCGCVGSGVANELMGSWWRRGLREVAVAVPAGSSFSVPSTQSSAARITSSTPPGVSWCASSPAPCAAGSGSCCAQRWCQRPSESATSMPTMAGWLRGAGCSRPTSAWSRLRMLVERAATPCRVASRPSRLTCRRGCSLSRRIQGRGPRRFFPRRSNLVPAPPRRSTAWY